jgi:hypothetical protein
MKNLPPQTMPEWFLPVSINCASTLPAWGTPTAIEIKSRIFRDGSVEPVPDGVKPHFYGIYVRFADGRAASVIDTPLKKDAVKLGKILSKLSKLPLHNL